MIAPSLGVEYDGMKRDGRVNSGLQKPLEDGGSFPWEARKRGKHTSGP